MTKPQILNLAKQGDAEAIAALINRSLQPKGITATVKLTNGHLYVTLSAAKVPSQKIFAPFIHQGTIALGAPSIQSLTVAGLAAGSSSPNWEEEFNLGSPTQVQVGSTPQLSAPSATQAKPNLDSRPNIRQRQTSKKPLPSPPEPPPESSLSLEFSATPEEAENLLYAVGVFPPQGKLNLAYYYLIPKLAKSYLNFAPAYGLVIGATSVEYKGELAALLLTEKYLACFGFPPFNPLAQKIFIFNLKTITNISCAPNGLIIRTQKYDPIVVYFPHVKSGQKFVENYLNNQTKIAYRKNLIAPDIHRFNLFLLGIITFIFVVSINIFIVALTLKLFFNSFIFLLGLI
ncbi:MAG TPA: hypothetical protein IGS52_05665 [Oscillatoriaceae cyanobacterium M33_DOE_052]|uniref:Uncharacterized protein n=1 Tax=Planktothricoides sp. SpSt-374 TaxID=2282167 RepID=A0A7C3ZHM3_9CYAN|nr:hypothetical protein [Oscillatoriaceae cyanobacterium M33_DOE_052]